MLALALGGFGIGTTEFVSMGLLPEIARSLGVSEPTAGHLISAYALGVVVGAPLIATASARVNRRVLLIGLMLAFTVGNAASVIAPNYPTLMLARFVAGLPHGAYFGVAALVAAHMAERGGRAKAVGQVMLGLSVANVVGVPVATWLGDAFGWRSAYVLVALVGVATLLALLRFLPHLGTMRMNNPLDELGALKRPQVWLTLAIAVVGCGGMFAFYTYITLTLTKVAGLPSAGVPLVLMLFGLGMVAGNMIGGRIADTSVVGGIAIGLLVVGVSLGLFALVAGIAPLAIVMVFFIGISGSISVPALQTRLMDVADHAQTLAAALNHSALNLANALGAWLGGMVIAAGYGYRAPALAGVGLAVAGMVVLGVAVALGRRATPGPAVPGSRGRRHDHDAGEPASEPIA
ncbi:MFS transporter [Gordonia jinhuaensis]|uniref:Permease of the major facilitator superfamily protein n=1 Tax=Gordonia jinhuaensis TaxID=1517702 RepID=A0A916SUB6_9ACTN|nr:MFS transporter [Gordonia jinhuaensis]GGB17093.1 putative permease of the major facilitator superfamily protein [Gordonia jinhuaensis]